MQVRHGGRAALMNVPIIIRFMSLARLFIGDALRVMKRFQTGSIDMVMTSPPYWSLRDYGVAEQIGLEPTFEEYIEKVAAVSLEVMRALKSTGSLYLNLGDTYAGCNMPNSPQKQGSVPGPVCAKVKQIRRKSLIGIPWRIALRLLGDGWNLRNAIIWHKTNGLPSSAKDRLSNRYEHLFHFVKSERYYYNLEAIREPYRATSFNRFASAATGNFVEKNSKHDVLGLPPAAQFSEGKTPVPNWLRDLACTQGQPDARALRKLQRMYKQAKGRIKHGHYGGGRYAGIQSTAPGKNPGDVWQMATSGFKGAHFSVYPEQLCVIPVLSSCPRLVCSECGAPKRETVIPAAFVSGAFNIRVRDAQKGILSRKWGKRVSASADEVGRYQEFFYQSRQKERVIAEGCSCGAGFKPGVILDPFVGSGTTMKVALEMGRGAIGIELNPEYVALVQQRVPLLREEDIVFEEKQLPNKGVQDKEPDADSRADVS